MFALPLLALPLALQLAAASPSPAPANSPPPLTLADAMTRARRASPDRERAAALAAGAADAAGLAGRRRNPLLELQIENLGPDHSVTTGVPRDIFAVGMQSFDAPGVRAGRRAVAMADRDTAAVEVTRLEREAALAAMRAYMQALRTRDNVEALRAARTGLDTLIATMTARVAEGYAAEADRLRFLAEAARLDGELARATLELARALSRLTIVLARSTPVEPSQLVAPGPVREAMLPTDRTLLAAIEALPELRLATARRERATQAAALERLRRRPEATVTAGYKRTNGFHTALGGIAVSVPLFDQNGEAIALAEAEARAVELELTALRQRALGESQALLLGATTLVAHAARMDRELLAPAEGVRNAARATFREGTADVLKLVDAERVYTDVQREALAIRIDAYIAAIEVRFAAGQEELP